MLNSIPCSFLDRDGVVIEDCHHLRDPNKVRLCPGSQELISKAFHYNIPVVIITNQSGISRGLFGWEHFEMVNKRLQDLLGAKSPLSAIYANGYGPDAPINSWRKPSPRMLFEASQDLNIDLGRSVLIGDRLSDLQAGAGAGLAALVHVLTGHGRESRDSVIKWSQDNSKIAFSIGSLAEANNMQFLSFK